MTRALSIALALAAGCKPDVKPPAPKVPVTPKASVDAELLRTLAVLATSKAPTPNELGDTRRRIDAGTLTIGGYIDSLLATDAFRIDVAPLVIFRDLVTVSPFGAPEGFALKHTDGDKRVYYLTKPCPYDKAIPVIPWWSYLDGKPEPIRVCDHAYQPTKWTLAVPKGGAETFCNSEAGESEDPPSCGCGPNLLRCGESREMRQRVYKGLRDELRGSVAYNIQHGQPLESIFTANETFRDRYAEYLMRTYVAEAARKPIPEQSLRELADWPADGKWAARDDLAPGMNAGVLTSPQIVHFQVDRRQRMTAIYDALWCIQPDSVGATPESLLSIKGADLQINSDGWKELAARPICTGCHARLDYGFQFFWGFPNGNIQAYYVPTLQKQGRGPLYMHDISDGRGDAELTPQGFAKLATHQPEFRTCMARDFGEYVLGNQLQPDQLDALVAGMQADKTTARDLMRAALLQLVASWSDRKLARAAGEPPPKPAGATIVITKDLHAQLATCLDCHDHEADRPDFSPPQLSRGTVVGMLEQVAFGKMPKDHPLGAADREKFLSAFVAATWSGADADAARTYFVDHMAALPAYRPEIAFALVHAIAGASSPQQWRMLENTVRSSEQQLTPGAIGVTGLEAIESCREANKTDAAARKACIQKALSLRTLVAHPPATP